METWFTTYAAAEWGMALGDASRCLIVANLGAIVSFIPVGSIASRVGRKRTILVGICMTRSTSHRHRHRLILANFALVLRT